MYRQIVPLCISIIHISFGIIVVVGNGSNFPSRSDYPNDRRDLPTLSEFLRPPSPVQSHVFPSSVNFNIPPRINRIRQPKNTNAFNQIIPTIPTGYFSKFMEWINPFGRGSHGNSYRQPSPGMKNSLYYGNSLQFDLKPPPPPPSLPSPPLPPAPASSPSSSHPFDGFQYQPSLQSQPPFYSADQSHSSETPIVFSGRSCDSCNAVPWKPIKSLSSELHQKDFPSQTSGPVSNPLLFQGAMPPIFKATPFVDSYPSPSSSSSSFDTNVDVLPHEHNTEHDVKIDSLIQSSFNYKSQVLPDLKHVDRLPSPPSVALASPSPSSSPLFNDFDTQNDQLPSKNIEVNSPVSFPSTGLSVNHGDDDSKGSSSNVFVKYTSEYTSSTSSPLSTTTLSTNSNDKYANVIDSYNSNRNRSSGNVIINFEQSQVIDISSVDSNEEAFDSNLTFSTSPASSTSLNDGDNDGQASVILQNNDGTYGINITWPEPFNSTSVPANTSNELRYRDLNLSSDSQQSSSSNSNADYSKDWYSGMGFGVSLDASDDSEDKVEKKLEKKKKKQVQIIIPYISENKPSPFSNEYHSSFDQKASGNHKSWKTSVVNGNTLAENDHSKVENQKEDFFSSIDISRLQKNIDNWTIQEFSKGTTASTVTTTAKSTATVPTIYNYLLQSKKIPNNYLTTVESIKISSNKNILKEFDLEHEASEVKTVSSLETTTTTEKTETTNHQLNDLLNVSSDQENISSWEEIATTISNNERVVVVTPLPKLKVSKVINKSVEKAYQILPQAVNNLQVEPATGPVKLPLWDIMDSNSIKHFINNNSMDRTNIIPTN